MYEYLKTADFLNWKGYTFKAQNTAKMSFENVIILLQF